MEREKIRVWITKYALTSGIKVVDAEVLPSGCMIRYRVDSCFTQSAYGKDWHKTQESAIIRAEEMRNKKIASLTKKIELLKRMSFTLSD